MQDRPSLEGRLVSGLGEAAGFTQTGWARGAFISLVGVDPWPGTVNLELDEARTAEWVGLRTDDRYRISLPAPDPAWCDAWLYPIHIAGGPEGAVVLPEVADYPPEKIEFISPVAVRQTLGLSEGDIVRIEFAGAGG